MLGKGLMQMGLTLALASRLIAFTKAAWTHNTEVTYEKRLGYYKAESGFELKAGEQVFRVVVTNGRYVEMWIDGLKIGSEYGSASLGYANLLVNPRELSQMRVGWYLKRLFRSEIRSAVQLYHAERRLEEHQRQVTEQQKQLGKQQRLAEAIATAERSLGT